jgi:hypothetical protein
MSGGKGGGSTTTTPWSGVQPYMTQGYKFASNVLQNPPSYYPGQTYVGPLPMEQAAFGNQAAFLGNAFGMPVNLDSSYPQPSYGLSGDAYYPNTRAAGGNLANDLWRGVAGGISGGPAIQPVPGADTAAGGPMAATGGQLTGKSGAMPATPATTGPTTGATPAVTPQYASMVGAQQALAAGGPSAAGASALGQAFGQNLGVFGGQQNLIRDPGDMTAGMTAPNLNLNAGLTAPSVSWNPINPMEGMAPASVGFRLPDLMKGVNQASSNYDVPDLTAGIGRLGFDPAAYTPTIDPEARAAMSRMMSGQPDYSGLQGAVDAATAPMMRNFQQQVLPAIAQQSNLLNNNTGAIKDLNRIIPEMERNVGDIGAQLAWQERMRADQSQQLGAQLAANSGLQAYGMGLQGAGQRSSLDQAVQQLLASQRSTGAQMGLTQSMNNASLADSFARTVAGQNMGGAQIMSNVAMQNAQLKQAYNQMAADSAMRMNQLGLEGALGMAGIGMDWNRLLAGQNQASANLGMDWNRLMGSQNLGAGNLQLGVDQARQGALDQYRQQVLGLGGLYGDMAGQTASNMQAGAGLFPQTMSTGLMPSMFQQQYASGYLRPFAEQALQGDISRYNYGQNLPMEMGNWYSGMLSGLGGSGFGTSTQKQGGMETLGQAADLASTGYLMYLLAASDREAKEDIRPAGRVLDRLRRLPIYRWRYKGDQTQHLGPMAQDFQEAFGVGDGKTIALVDVMGVLLAVMKELAEQKEVTA